TTASLAAAGVTPTVEAAQPSAAALVEAIVVWEAAHRDLAHPAGSAEMARASLPATDRPVDSASPSRR
ncbi:MAG: hypothetical protein ACKOBP_06575, partial [Planctomycetia bacterium]